MNLHILAEIQFFTPMTENNKSNETKRLLNIPGDKRSIIIAALAAICLFPFVTPSVALLAGFVVTNVIGQSSPKKISNFTKILLQCSVVGLGFGMNLQSAVKAGKDGLLFTVSAIAVARLPARQAFEDRQQNHQPALIRYCHMWR